MLSAVTAMPAKLEPSFPIQVGTEPSEIVLRGGFLTNPVVLNDCVEVDGTKFLYLWKTRTSLALFLNKRGAYARTLKTCRVFGRLAALRNSEYKKRQRAFGAAGEADKSVLEMLQPVSADALDIDGAEEGDTGKSKGTRRLRRAVKVAKKLMPRAATVSYERPGQVPWEPSVLLELATKAVAMECTSDNFRILFDLVRHDMLDQETVGESAGNIPKPAARLPRVLADGSREYFIRGRWVRKTKTASENPNAVADKRKFSCLVRRPSDEASGPRVRKNRSKARAQAIMDTGRGIEARSDFDLDL